MGDLVEKELMRRKILNTFKGEFKCVTYALTSVDVRGSMPTNFDCNLGYTMGYAAGTFIQQGRNGLLVNVSDVEKEVSEWKVNGIPAAATLTVSKGLPGQSPNLEIEARSCLLYDHNTTLYGMPPEAERLLRNPGPIQFAGPCSETRATTLNHPSGRLGQFTEIQK